MPPPGPSMQKYDRFTLGITHLLIVNGVEVRNLKGVVLVGLADRWVKIMHGGMGLDVWSSEFGVRS